MPNIKPVSDLGNYTEVLRDIAVGEPVFLTKNGRGRYVIIDMDEYEKQRAALKLLSALSKAEKTAEEKGWLSEDDADALSAEGAGIFQTFGNISGEAGYGLGDDVVDFSTLAIPDHSLEFVTLVSSCA